MANRSFRTPKGTELPLLNLRGRDYLEVKFRLVWFREDHPDWSIETEILSVTELSAYVKATIRDQTGRVFSTAHKFETKRGFPDFIEKAETGAIGRALALVGYGTQFCADELSEGDRIVDAPVQRRPSPTKAEPKDSQEQASTPQPQKKNNAEPNERAPGDFQIKFGKKYKDMRIRDIPRQELEGYIEWLQESAAKKGLMLSTEAYALKLAAEAYLNAANAQVGA